MEIAGRFVFGQSKKEIADATCRSVHTVDKTIKNIYEKLDLHKATELSVWFFEHTFDLAKEVAEMRNKIFTVSLSLIMMCSSALDISTDPMRVRRRARRRHSTEIVLITNART